MSALHHLNELPRRDQHDPLHMLDLADLSMLLSLEPFERLGKIIQLNGEARYHHRLNVVELLVQLAELRQQTNAALQQMRRK